MRRSRTWRALPALLLAGLTLLVPLPVAAEEPVPVASAAASRASARDAQGLEYRLQRAPQAGVTVVFENGLGLDFETWAKVLPLLGADSQWLVYNRPGVGQSAGAEGDATPAAVDPAAARMQALLQSQALPPPYVLVGHSLGGQFVQSFAQQYPEQVVGLVLVDALPVGVARSYDDFPWVTRVGLRLFASASLRAELAAMQPMGEHLLTQPGRFGGPMVRIVAQNDAPKPEGPVRDLLRGVVYAEDFGIWSMDVDAAEARMAVLYPQAELRTVRAHHRVQEQLPEQVVAAIRSVLEQRPGRAPSAPARPTLAPDRHP